MLATVYVVFCVGAAYAVALFAGARQRSLLPWFLAGVSLRVSMLALDAAGFLTVPNSTVDAAEFIRRADILSHQSWGDLVALLDARSSNNYSVLGAALFKITGFHPYSMQASNLVAGAVNICLATLLVRKYIGSTAATWAAALLCLYPFAAFNSVIALREELAISLFIFGLTALMRWVDRGNIGPYLAASGLFVLATLVHPGFVGAVIATTGYFLVVAVKGLSRSSNGRSALITAFVGLVMFLGALAVLAGGVQLSKGMDLSLDRDTLSGTVEARFQRESEGGSAYPSFISQGDPFAQPWLVPARAMYFLYSPFPWDVRSPVHLAGLMVGLLYMWLSVRAWRAWRRGALGGRRKVLGLIFIMLTMVFALGTTNSGTAIRHKTKFFPLLVMLAAPTFRRRIVFSQAGDQIAVRRSVRTGRFDQ